VPGAGRETFVPLAHPPGHAQVDFGEAMAVIGGVRRKIHFFCMDLPQSDACFVKAYPARRRRRSGRARIGVRFFGGVPLSILYDNTKIAVAKICGDGRSASEHARSPSWQPLPVPDRFGRPGKGNDKGKVEGLVKYARSNFMVPIPHGGQLRRAQRELAERCRRPAGRSAGRHARRSASGSLADLAALRALPAGAAGAVREAGARVSSTALVRYRTNDYSVPTAYGFQDVMVKGFVDEVVILCGARRSPGIRAPTARRVRVRPAALSGADRDQANALDQAAALQDWDCPKRSSTCATCWRRAWAIKGKREFIQVLRLMEAFRSRS
jgi:hypothetical protein